MKHAAIAIGSNSTRMVCAEFIDGKMYPSEEGRAETQLMLGLDAGGRITPDALERAAADVTRLFFQALRAGADDCVLLATSASRDAVNSAELAGRIKAATGLDMTVISGTEEARLGFLAAFGREKGIMLDIGGGSTEIAAGENGQIRFSCSAQLGASRLFKMKNISSHADAEEMYQYAKSVLAGSIGGLTGAYPTLAVLGNTGTSAASLLCARPMHGMQADGYTAYLDDVRTLLHKIAPLSVEERLQLPGILPSRAHILPHGLCILSAAMELLRFDSFTVCGKCNLHGYLSDRYL